MNQFFLSRIYYGSVSLYEIFFFGVQRYVEILLLLLHTLFTTI